GPLQILPQPSAHLLRSQVTDQRALPAASVAERLQGLTGRQEPDGPEPLEAMRRPPVRVAGPRIARPGGETQVEPIILVFAQRAGNRLGEQEMHELHRRRRYTQLRLDGHHAVFRTLHLYRFPSSNLPSPDQRLRAPTRTLVYTVVDQNGPRRGRYSGG